MMETAQSIAERWRERMRDGDSSFTEESVAAVEAELARFLRALRAAQPGQVAAELERVVESLNEIGGISGRFPDLIETEEREELVPFLLDAARDAGMEIPPGEDPTEAWRLW